MIADHLLNGSASAVSAKDLASLLAISARDVTECINNERKGGLLILANGKGYFLPSTDSETVAYLRTLRHRIGELQTVYRAMSNAAGMNEEG